MITFFIDKNIAKAKTISTVFYTYAVFFEKSKEKIFANTWQFIGDINLVKEQSNCYPFTLLDGYLDEPLLLTKDKQDKIHCLSNVCTHRGNILVNEFCKTSNIRCKYHGRLFELDGKFKSMPEFKEVRNFPSQEDNLSALPLYQWGNWLFTSLNKNFTAKIFLKQMMRRVEWMPVDDFVFGP